MNVQGLDAEQLLDQLSRLPGAARIAVLAAVAGLVVGVYLFVLHGGQRDALAASQGQLAVVQAKIVEARAVAANLKSFETQRSALQAELEQALQRLPNEKELAVLLTDISSLGKKSGLEIRSFRPGAEANRGFYAEVPIAIELYGSYHEVAVFFDRLSRLSRIVNITQLNMAPESANGTSNKLKVKGVAATFRFVEEPVAVAGE